GRSRTEHPATDSFDCLCLDWLGEPASRRFPFFMQIPGVHQIASAKSIFTAACGFLGKKSLHDGGVLTAHPQGVYAWPISSKKCLTSALGDLRLKPWTSPHKDKSMMTDTEALEQAMRRWGEDGYVRRQNIDGERFTVGVREGVLYWVKGAGKSWEEAFKA